MKSWKYKIRITGILIIGFLLLKMTHQFKHSTFIFDTILFASLSFIGLIFLIWSLFTDLDYFQKKKKVSSLIPTCLGAIFIVIIYIWNVKINSNFDKPTLIRIHYDGDFNGTGIDFKTDGTYIVDNYAIGMSDYFYGNYIIEGKIIILDRDSIDNVIMTNQLEIKSKVIEYSDQAKTEKYVYQINGKGNILKHVTEFRLVVDNRSE